MESVRNIANRLLDIVAQKNGGSSKTGATDGDREVRNILDSNPRPEVVYVDSLPDADKRALAALVMYARALREGSGKTLEEVHRTLPPDHLAELVTSNRLDVFLPYALKASKGDLNWLREEP